MTSPDCAAVQDILSDLFDGRFAGGDPVRLHAERHLASCAPCRLMLEDFARFREVLRPAPAAVPDPAAFSARLDARLNTEARIRRHLRLRIVAAAAALLLTVGIGVALTRSPTPAVPSPGFLPPSAAPTEPVPASWKPLGDATPATLAELAEQQALDSLVDDLRLLRGGRADRDAIYREVVSVRDLSRRPHLLREVAYAP